MRPPILSWSEISKTPLEEREVSTMDGVDRGFGNLLVAALRGATVSRTGPAYNDVRAFLARPPAQQIIKSPYSDPRSFMKALRAAGRGRLEDTKLGEAINKQALPIIMFQRDLAHSLYEGDRYAPKRRWDEIAFSDGSSANVSQHHLTMSYRIAILSWDLESLDLLSSLMGAYFRHHARQFGYQIHLYHTPINAFGDVVTNALLWDDASPGIETDRLMALSCTVEVIAEAFEAQGLAEKEISYTLLEPVALFGGE
ncbi:hypothetical protein [Aeromonas salmonicida]|uniref:hypothetical protein n=1 Tax=Aeromonas salmonicida TaxID=645 RepID=UPI002330804D|nr:hypothetical protein [Aeromonas salmonicida]WCH25155.1 hypothetical protein ONZ54_23095 [Aeromonas salmonicida]